MSDGRNSRLPRSMCQPSTQLSVCSYQLVIGGSFLPNDQQHSDGCFQGPKKAAILSTLIHYPSNLIDSRSNFRLPRLSPPAKLRAEVDPVQHQKNSCLRRSKARPDWLFGTLKMALDLQQLSKVLEASLDPRQNKQGPSIHSPKVKYLLTALQPK